MASFVPQSGLRKPAGLSPICEKTSATDIAAVSHEERLALIKTASKDLCANLEKDLSTVDLPEYPEMAEAVNQVKSAIEGARKPISDIMFVVTKIVEDEAKSAGEKHKAEQKAHGEDHNMDQEEMQVKTNDIGLQASHWECRAQQDSHAVGSDGSSKRKQQEDFGSADHWWKEHKEKAKSQHAPFSARHHHAQRIAERIQGGDHAFVNKMFGSAHSFSGGALPCLSRMSCPSDKE